MKHSIYLIKARYGPKAYVNLGVVYKHKEESGKSISCLKKKQALFRVCFFFKL